MIRKFSTKTRLASFAAAGMTAAAVAGAACGPGGGDALKIGYLADYTGQLAEFGPNIEKGVELAVKQINAAGGVNGQDVVYVTGDTGLNAAMATTEATRLIDVEGVHAIVGPLASGVTRAVAEGVLKDSNIPGISPSATAPDLGEADDGDYLFRTAVSDAAQGLVLANNVVENASRSGASSNVGVVFVDNDYGQGLAGSFEANFDGTVTSAAYTEGTTSFRSQLQEVSGSDQDALVIIGYEESTVILREALADELFETYYFVDGNRSEDIASDIGADNVAGFFGTSPGSGESDAFDAAFMEEFGMAVPATPFIREAYDATIAIALAAEAVDGELTGAAIRDQLRSVTSSPGTKVTPTASSIESGLESAAAGNAVDYDGLSSIIAWDSNGDTSGGFIDIWTFSESGAPETVDTITEFN